MGEKPSDAEPPLPAYAATRLGRLLLTEESIYGLILVSGMIVVSRTLAGASAAVVSTVIVTVVVFYLAHVYAGTLAHMAVADGHGNFAASLRTAARRSSGMLAVALVPVAVLLLGVVKVVDDDTAIWAALGVDVVLLAALGWSAVARWNMNVWARLGSALITAAFGVIVMALKAVIHH